MIAVGAVAAAGIGLLATGTASAEPGGGVGSVPVSFDVVTSNRSGVPCADTPVERHVVVRGHLTSPRSELRW